ncbi:hypothetical protein SARC_12005, partial [Sphaeroforma arctica JP610]
AVFTKTVTVAYNFEQNQTLRLLVVDIDKPDGGLDKQDIIGVVKLTLSSILTSNGQSKKVQLVNEKKRKIGGIIQVSAEEMIESKSIVALDFKATKLDNKDGLFGKSDPFLRISRQRENGEFDAVYKTDVIKNNLNPNWKRFTIPFQTLANGDRERTLRIDVVDWNADGSEDHIGTVYTSVRALEESQGPASSMPVINEKKKAKKKKYKHSGLLHCVKCELIVASTFLDYVKSGMEIGLMIGIDFTASNRGPSDPRSLHYMNPNVPNDYVTAIQQVGQILANYDADNKFPSYGFGARIPPNGHVSHCFPINFNYNDPEITGIDGVLAHYQNCLSSVQLSGPTNFSPMIETALAQAKGTTAKNLKYTILVILTDGVICDMDNTIDQIVKASTEAMSIVIVGVGEADFGAMDYLDADDAPLVNRQGRKMARDIVQFVPYRDFKTKGERSIAEVTLAEIPEQVVSFMASKGIRPRPSPASLMPTPSVVSTSYASSYQYAPAGSPQRQASTSSANGQPPYPTHPSAPVPQPSQPYTAPYPSNPTIHTEDVQRKNLPPLIPDHRLSKSNSASNSPTTSILKNQSAYGNGGYHSQNQNTAPYPTANQNAPYPDNNGSNTNRQPGRSGNRLIGTASVVSYQPLAAPHDPYRRNSLHNAQRGGTQQVQQYPSPYTGSNNSVNTAPYPTNNKNNPPYPQ